MFLGTFLKIEALECIPQNVKIVLVPAGFRMNFHVQNIKGLYLLNIRKPKVRDHLTLFSWL